MSSESHLELFFRPIINPLNEKVLIYRAVPVVKTGDSVKTGAKQVLKHSGDPEVTAERNVDVLKLAALHLEAAHASGNDVLLMVPMNAKAMETKESTTLMVKALKALPSLCAKAMVIHLFDLPDRLTMNKLDDVVIPFLISTDKFVIEPPTSLTDYTDISGCNAQGVVLDLEPGEGAKIDLAKFWSLAAPRRLGMFIQNVKDETDIDLAKRYECRGMDGPIFGELLAKIGPRTLRSALKS
jgi:hypothetical protein